VPRGEGVPTCVDSSMAHSSSSIHIPRCFSADSEALALPTLSETPNCGIHVITLSL
jgi:hypothetical protein